MQNKTRYDNGRKLMATQWSSEDYKEMENVKDDTKQIEINLRAMLSTFLFRDGT